MQIGLLEAFVTPAATWLPKSIYSLHPDSLFGEFSLYCSSRAQQSCLSASGLQVITAQEAKPFTISLFCNFIAGNICAWSYFPGGASSLEITFLPSCPCLLWWGKIQLSVGSTVLIAPHTWMYFFNQKCVHLERSEMHLSIKEEGSIWREKWWKGGEGREVYRV